VHLYGRAEQPQRLVDQMAAEIVEQTTDLLGAAGLAPAALAVGRHRSNRDSRGRGDQRGVEVRAADAVSDQPP
jgi:hypothetical protein